MANSVFSQFCSLNVNSRRKAGAEPRQATTHYQLRVDFQLLLKVSMAFDERRKHRWLLHEAYCR